MPVFISYQQKDIVTAGIIYITLSQAGIETYWDRVDSESQTTDDITSVITKNINQCTHLITIISDETAKSWWVPFEIGEATIVENRISTFQLNSQELPDYLKKWPVMKQLDELRYFILSYKRDKKLAPIFEGVESFSAKRERDTFKNNGYTTTADDFHQSLKRSLGQA